MSHRNTYEMIPDQRSSICFPNKVHRSSQNKFAKCRINYSPALKPASRKETLCIALEVICELALVYSLNKTICNCYYYYTCLQNFVLSNQITFIVTSPQHMCLGEWNYWERAPDNLQLQLYNLQFTYRQYILTDLYRWQCAIYTYIY